MISAHILGIPVEESVLQLAPAGAAIVTVVAVAGRTRLDWLRRGVRHWPHRRARPYARRTRGPVR
jgi:hypothetical protein